MVLTDTDNWRAICGLLAPVAARAATRPSCGVSSRDTGRRRPPATVPAWASRASQPACAASATSTAWASTRRARLTGRDGAGSRRSPAATRRAQPADPPPGAGPAPPRTGPQPFRSPCGARPARPGRWPRRSAGTGTAAAPCCGPASQAPVRHRRSARQPDRRRWRAGPTASGTARRCPDLRHGGLQPRIVFAGFGDRAIAQPPVAQHIPQVQQRVPDPRGRWRRPPPARTTGTFIRQPR